MRRTTLILSISSLLLLVVCASLYVKTRSDADAMSALQRSEESTRAQYGQAIQDISTIQDSLNAIAVGEGTGLSSSSLSKERRLSPNQGDETLARIAELRAGIERTRVRIQNLETRLKQSTGQVAGLGRLVKQLKTGLAEKEQLVAVLSGQVDSLTTTVHEAQTQIAAQTDTLEERRRELGTVYYVIGTRTALLKDGLAVARGGVLGLGKTLDASGKMDPTAYRAVDTDQETMIPIAAAKARVLTSQAPGSYAIEPSNGQLVLRILDPHEFRKVRHLVIVTA